MGLFDSLTDAVDNTLTVVTGPLTGEMPSQRQVAQMIADGMTVAAVAAAFGVSVDIIEQLIGDD